METDENTDGADLPFDLDGGARRNSKPDSRPV
jgi:hypothetical protein